MLLSYLCGFVQKNVSLTEHFKDILHSNDLDLQILDFNYEPIVLSAWGGQRNGITKQGRIETPNTKPSQLQ